MIRPMAYVNDPWRVGDVVIVTPEQALTDLGEGPVIDVKEEDDGRVRALLVRFERGPREGVWYSPGTLRRLRNLEGEPYEERGGASPSPATPINLGDPRRSTPPSSAPPTSLVDRPSRASTPTFDAGLLARHDLVLRGWTFDEQVANQTLAYVLGKLRSGRISGETAALTAAYELLHAEGNFVGRRTPTDFEPSSLEALRRLHPGREAPQLARLRERLAWAVSIGLVTNLDEETAWRGAWFEREAELARGRLGNG